MGGGGLVCFVFIVGVGGFVGLLGVGVWDGGSCVGGCVVADAFFGCGFMIAIDLGLVVRQVSTRFSVGGGAWRLLHCGSVGRLCVLGSWVVGGFW